MAILEEINIKSFRGIKNLYVKNLGLINLFLGDNNCGKTSVLEAIELLRTSGNLANVYRIAKQRERLSVGSSNSAYDSFICMFPHDGTGMRIEVEGNCDSKKIRCRIEGEEQLVLLDSKEIDSQLIRPTDDFSGELETTAFEGIIDLVYGSQKQKEKISINKFSRVTGVPVSNNDDFKIVYVSPFEHLSGNVLNQILRNESYKKICLKALQLFDQDIEDILLLRSDVGNRPVEYIAHRKLGVMPISTYGDGIKKVLVLSNAVAAAAGGILLIDEIETAIHKKYYDDIFRFIFKACKAFKVQLFITTHSMEAIEGILATADYEKQKDTDDIRVITLRKEESLTCQRILSGREVFEDHEAYGFEVRQ